MIDRTKAAVAAVSIALCSAAEAATLPAISDDYEGTYVIANALGNHGLWLPGFLGDKTWDVTGGLATYGAGELRMTGQAENAGYTLDFDFTVYEYADHTGSLYCGQHQPCQNATQEMKDNIVFFDMGSNAIMGQITGATGTDLDGLVIDVIMRPLPHKPGQLGYGGNWSTLDFGYSNWLSWDVVQQPTFVDTGLSGGGDVNFDFLATDNAQLLAVPVPASFFLLLSVLFAAGAWASPMPARRRAT